MERADKVNGIGCAIIAGGCCVLVAWLQVSASEDQRRLERILALLEVHSERIWRQRPNLDTSFEGHPVLTDEDGFRLSGEPPADHPRTVVSLGGSPTFGYGVAHGDAYPARVERMLIEAGEPCRVINAGQIGYSSWQGVRLFRGYVETWDPDVVTLSYVVNDIDRLRFFFSDGHDDDHVTLPTAGQASKANAIGRIAPLRWLLQTRNRLAAKLGGGRRHRAIYELTHVRVPPDHYRANLTELVEMVRASGARPILIQMPFRLPVVVPPADPAHALALQGAREDLEQGDVAAAQAAVSEVLAADEFSSEARYIEGLLLERAGDRVAAREAFTDAVERVIYDCVRDARLYNRIMAEVAAELSVPRVDVTGALGGETADMAYFVEGDYIHPNADGHAQVAQRVAPTIRQILGARGDSSVNPAPRSRRGR